MKTNVLSSDILEHQFGPTVVQVLYQGAASRIIKTSARTSGQVLELSHVRFIHFGVKKFPDVHQAIIAGMSMGTAFRAAGIKFIREQRFAYSYDLSGNFQQLFDSDKPGTVVIVSVMVGHDETPYAEILETYSPAVKWPRLSGKPNADQIARIKRFGTLLGKIGDSAQT